MDVQTPTKTSTAQVVGIVVGMTAAFAMGVSMIFLMSSSLQKEIIEPLIQPSANTALMLTDVVNIEVGSDPHQIGDGIVKVEFGQFDATGQATTLLGTYNPNDFVNTYVDGSTSEKSIALQIKITPSSFQPHLMSISGGNFPNISSLIPAAHAQIQIIDAHTVCMNDASNTIAYVPEETGLFGIPTAHAQININTNTNPDPTDFTIYYIDENGNIYSDVALRNMLNPIDCESITDKIYSPIDLTDVTSTNNLNDATATFATSWTHVLGHYNFFRDEQFVDYDEMYGSTNGLPLFVITNAFNDSEFPVTVPQSTLTLEDNYTSPTSDICLPEDTLQDGDWNVYFYDIDGNPYSDIFLQNKVACGTTNVCSSVNCLKSPVHPCCRVVTEAEEAL